MHVDLVRRINKAFILKCTDSTGHKRLIGAGQLNKFVGANSDRLITEMYVDALQRDGSNFEITLSRGITIRFNKRNNDGK